MGEEGDDDTTGWTFSNSDLNMWDTAWEQMAYQHVTMTSSHPT